MAILPHCISFLIFPSISFPPQPTKSPPPIPVATGEVTVPGTLDVQQTRRLLQSGKCDKCDTTAFQESLEKQLRNVYLLSLSPGQQLFDVKVEERTNAVGCEYDVDISARESVQGAMQSVSFFVPCLHEVFFPLS